MNKDQKSLIQDCISELNLQIDFFEENKSSFMSPGKTWSDRTNKMLNQLKANKDILKNFNRSNIFKRYPGNMNWLGNTFNFVIAKVHKISPLCKSVKTISSYKRGRSDKYLKTIPLVLLATQ